MQFDADTVGTESVAADAEICMLAADTLEALGVPRGQYVVKVSNRKVLDGLREIVGLSSPENDAHWLTVMRALDKFDRLHDAGVRALLGPGRRDESGDFTKGAGLNRASIETVMSIFEPVADAEEKIAQLDIRLRDSTIGQQGRDELETIWKLVAASGYDDGRVTIDPSVVRGLEYYTGPVFEAELTFPVKNEDGQVVRFGSVGGGGRYDGLVERFLGQKVPATGFSIGVSRLQAALAQLNKDKAAGSEGPVVVLVMDRNELPRYQKMAQTLRQAGIRAEMYLGTSGMKAQMKYADRRGSPCVVIQGGDELARGEVQIKDLIEGAKAAATIKDAKEWRESRPAQFSVPASGLVEAVRGVLDRHRG
jgi:histidyl-tRNA synthetase